MIQPGFSTTGVIQFIAGGNTSSTYAYDVRLYGWQNETTMQPINRSGRTLGRPKFRLGDQYAKFHAEGDIQIQRFPYPDNPQYLEGTNSTLTLIQNLNPTSGTSQCYISFPALISNFTLTRKESRNNPSGNDDLWKMTLTAEKNGPATINWNGTQFVVGYPTKNEAQTDEGLTKTYDPNSLRTGATQRFDVQFIADNDTAEFLELLTFCATATPPIADNYSNNSQITTANWFRTDSSGGYFILTWNLNNTKQQVEFPNSKQTVDNASLNSSAVVSKVNATTTTFTPLVLRTIGVGTLTPGSTLYSSNFGLRTTDEDIEFPGTWTSLDNNSLSTTALVTTVHNHGSVPSTPTPPDTTKLDTTKTVRITDPSSGVGQDYTVWSFAMRDSEDRANFPIIRQSRSVLSANEAVDAQEVAASGTIQVQADALFTSQLATDFFMGLDLRNLTDGTRQVILRYRDAGILLGNVCSGPRYVKTRLNGTAPQMFIVSNISYGTGQRLIQFGQQWTSVSKEILTVERTLKGSTVPRQNPSTIAGQTLPFFGNTNDSAFLGFGSLTLSYDGVADRLKYISGATMTFQMKYRISVDPLGIIIGDTDRYLAAPQKLVTGISTTGWTNVSSLGITDIIAATASSFAAFIAT